MRRWIELALSTIVFTILAIGCARQPAPQRLIYNIPGPEVPLSYPEWDLYEHHFPTELTAIEAAAKLQRLGYRFLTPAEEHLAKTFVFQQSKLVSLSFGLTYLDHPIMVLIKPENMGILYILGFDEGLMPRPLRGYYEHAKLGEEYGWLVMRQKP